MNTAASVSRMAAGVAPRAEQVERQRRAADRVRGGQRPARGTGGRARATARGRDRDRAAAQPHRQPRQHRQPDERRQRPLGQLAQRQRAEHEPGHRPCHEPPRVAPEHDRPAPLGGQREPVEQQPEQHARAHRLLRPEHREQDRGGDEREAEAGRRLQRRADEHRQRRERDRSRLSAGGRDEQRAAGHLGRLGDAEQRRAPSARCRRGSRRRDRARRPRRWR